MGLGERHQIVMDIQVVQGIKRSLQDVCAAMGSPNHESEKTFEFQIED